MAEQIEITAEFRRERHRFYNESGDLIVADAFANSTINKVITIRGQAELGELEEGQSYRFYGRWKSYTNKRTNEKEEQFWFETFVTETPACREGVISYLKRYGEGYGLGPARCEALWNAFGSDAVKITREDPLRSVEALRAAGLAWREDQALAVSQRLSADQSTENMKLDLAALLNGRGFPRAIATLAIQRWGNRAAQLIKRDPFRLLELKGVGFLRCDAMYLELGLNPAKLKRQALAAWYAIARDNEGHTWFAEKVPAAFLKSTITGGLIDCSKALRLAVRAGLLAKRVDRHGHVWYAEANKAQHETDIAQAYVYSREETLFWPSASKIRSVTEHQREELGKALQSPIAFLLGSPGTGKTWCVASLVEALAAHVGLSKILIGTPTGKAAVRVTENLSNRQIDLQARTWYSMLTQLEMMGERYFGAKVLIGDETSMNDVDLMAWILRARPVGTHVLFVGDLNQLPPVGHGAPMRDLLRSGASHGELKEIKRSSGGIVEACAAIRDGRKWEPSDNLVLHTAWNPEQQIESIFSWLDEAERNGLDKVWDVQIVVAVNEKSPLSRLELNTLLQARLNENEGVEKVRFRRADKVVNTKNGFFKIFGLVESDAETNSKNQVFVANGEIGKVLHVDAAKMIIEVATPLRVIEVPLKSDEGPNVTSWDLAYVLSCHKLQGSESPWVLVLLDEYPGAMRLCSREWFYTGISRAKSKCVIIGKRATADRMIECSALAKRKTFLRERINSLKAMEVLATI